MKFAKPISVVLLLAMLLSTLVLPAAAQTLDKSPNTIPAKTTTAEETTEEKEVNPFDLPEKKITALYTALSGKFTVSPIRKGDPDVASFAELISSLEDKVKPAHIDEVEAASTIEASFVVVRSDGVRTIYTLNKNNRLMVDGSMGYTIPEATYKSLLAMYQKERKEANYVQWLIYMKPSLITDITYNSGDGKVVSLKEAGYLNNAISLVRSIRPATASSEERYDPYEAKLSANKGTTLVTVHFEDEGFYNLFFTGDILQLEADGYHIGRQYTLVNGESKRIMNALTNPEKAFAPAETTEKAA